MKSIQWIIDPTTHWVKRDGYTKHITTVTNVKTGESVSMDECEGNVRGYINASSPNNQIIHASPETSVSYKEFRRLYEHLPVLGVCVAQDALHMIKHIS